MLVAIYLRKSRGQDEDLNKHKEQLVGICNSNEWIYDIYSEIGSSDKFEERLELTKLLNNITKYKKVLVVALDRLSRNELHQALITQTLKENDIEVVTPSKTYNFNKENDIIMSDFEKLLARSEFRLIKKRLVTGKISSFKQGNWVQGKAPLPYEYNRETRSLDIVPEKFEEWNRIKELALKGYSSYVIGEKLGINPLKIRRLLRNKTLLGYAKYKGEYIKGKHIPVISEDEWNIIQNFITKRTNGDRRTKHQYPFTNIVKCSCGHSRSATRRKDRNNVEYINKCRYCNDSGTLVDNIHSYIRSELKNEMDRILIGFNSNDNKDKLKKLNNELKNIDKDIDRNSKKLIKVKEMILNDIIDISEGSIMSNNIKNSIKSLEQQKELIKSDIKHIDVDTKQTIDNLRMVDKVLKENLKDEEINMLYKIIIDKIIIEDKIVKEVIWR